jgi:uncharacterized membrane protein YgaE (UPF0421/DUF939 family)
MQRMREQLAGASAHGTERWRDAWESVVLASVAAALAWLIAHTVLGHPQPFFAPIAAAISLSTSRIQRSRRIVQMVGGVLIGIVVAEVLVALVGTGTAAIGIIAFATFTVAVLGGAGVFGEGMMFANQAAASAILVVALHRAGTGSERAVDALVGGAVALVLGVILFPANPLRLLRAAERAVLQTLAVAVQRAVAPREQLRTGEEDWTLRMGYTVHQRLATLARARATAHANVRIAPRRWRLRPVVDAENDRTARLDLLANAVVGLVRATMVEEGPLPEPLVRQIGALGQTLDRLATVDQPCPPALRQHVLRVAHSAVDYASTVRRPHGATTTAILGATATDLSRLVEAPS